MSSCILLTLTLLVTMVTVDAWMQGSKRREWYGDDLAELGQYYPRGAYRRSYWPCAQQGEKCSDDKKCCSKSETCLTRDGRSRCMDLRGEVIEGGLKPMGDTCESSTECVDMCCREFHVHRRGRMLTCGPQDEDKIIYHKCV